MLAAAGMSAVASPVLAIRLRLDPAEISGLGAAAFTSANGVRAFAAASPRRDIPAFVVGRATARAARAAGFDEIHQAAGDSAALAALISERRRRLPSAGDLVHFSGEALAADLVGALRRLGLAARRVVAYAAEPLPELSPGAVAALRAPGPDLFVALFSPRSARLFLQGAERAGLGGALADSGAACLSPAVAAAAREAIWARIVVAAAPDGAALIEALKVPR